MGATDDRRREDLRRLQQLCGAASGRLRILEAQGDPPSRIRIELAYRTAASPRFPRDVSERTIVRIDLPERYPYEAPRASVETPIFHPNVFENGRICLGDKWLATEGLDLLVRRIVDIVVFEPTRINLKPPANRAAAEWYRTAAPELFPTDRFPIPSIDQAASRIGWKDLSTAASASPVPEAVRVVRLCPRCRQALRVALGASSRCPKCQHVFQAAT
jgi:hypothetical protein